MTDRIISAALSSRISPLSGVYLKLMENINSSKPMTFPIGTCTLNFVSVVRNAATKCNRISIAAARYPIVSGLEMSISNGANIGFQSPWTVIWSIVDIISELSLNSSSCLKTANPSVASSTIWPNLFCQNTSGSFFSMMGRMAIALHMLIFISKE